MADANQNKEQMNEASEADENLQQESEQTEEANDINHTAEAEDTEQADEEEVSEKKSLFGRKKEKADKKQELIDELNDKLKRSMAEFDNFRKRTAKEKSQMYEIGAREVIEKILPIVDNFERAFDNVQEQEKEDPFISGMDMVFKQLLTALEAMGVTPIEAVGAEFNPDLHNAVMQVASEEYDSGIVAQELQKGYKYKDSVVRHSMVAVVE